MICSICGSKENTKSLFAIYRNAVGPMKKDVLIKGEFWRNPNSPGAALCKDCMAIAFEECAKHLRTMSDRDFSMNV